MPHRLSFEVAGIGMVLVIRTDGVWILRLSRLGR